MNSWTRFGDNPVAVIIPNYKMNLWAETLTDHINTFTKHPYKLEVVNNGSVSDSTWMNVGLPDKLEMTHAVLMGLHYADALEYVYGIKFFAYWIITTSMEFLEEKDYLTSMVDYMACNNRVVMCSPAIEGTAWDCLSKQGTGVRDVWGVDNNAVLMRADWFNSIGRYDPELVMGWGPALETSYIARKQDKRICVFDDLPMKKHDGIAEKLGARDISREERNAKGAKEMDRVLGAKYGPDYLERLGHDYR